MTQSDSIGEGFLDPLKNLKAYPVSVLLVDDQLVISEAVHAMLKEETDIAFHYCNDPAKALRMAHDVRPTVILQDLVMPGVDGLTLLRYFQANPDTKDVPVIVLSTKEDPLVKANAFALGAADYLVKLPDKIELLARIRHHSAAYIRLLERNDAYKKLVEGQEILNADLQNAAAYVTSLLPQFLQGDVEASWRFIPSTQLGGDAFGYHWLDADHFVMYLLDVCGHGVGAALLSISIMNVIYSESLVGVNFKDPAHVLTSLNDMFPMEKHNNMFFTMWYGIYNKHSRILTYSTAGHPPALLYNLDSTKGAVNPLRTEGLVLGAMPATKYMNQSCQVPINNRLLLFSDGVFELRKTNREMQSLDEFIKLMDDYVQTSNNDLTKVIQLCQEVQNTKAFADDFSIVEFFFH